MKYLKRYKIFLEADEFEISDTDSPDLKMAKEKMNTMKGQMNDYKTKKSLIDKIYSDIKKSDAEIEKELKNILGDTDVQNEEDRNPFLVEYSHLMRLERDINKLSDDNANDKIKVDDLQQTLQITEGEETKKSIQFKISDIKNRMSQRSSEIGKIKQDLTTKEKEHNNRMSKMDAEMKEYIKKLSTPK